MASPGYDNAGLKYEMQPQQPGYQQPYPGQTAVPMPASQVTVVTQQYKPWSWCTVVTASFSILLCTLFGYIGLLFAMLAYTDHKAKDYKRAEGKRKCAMGWSIAGIVFGIIFFIAIIVVAALVWTKVADGAQDYVRGAYNNYNN